MITPGRLSVVTPKGHVIITGGSSGIGLELAAIYLSQECCVSLIARGREGLECAAQRLVALSGRNAKRLGWQSADVTDVVGLQRAVAACEAAFGECSVLINCAGLVQPQPFDLMTSDTFDRQVAVNLCGSANATRIVYPTMKRRGNGAIVFVASGAALIGIHGYSAYCASKFALRGLADSLRIEAAPFGVNICICFPPDTQTPQYVGELPSRSVEAAVMMGSEAWNADVVARMITNAVARNRSEIYFSFQLRILAYFGPLVRPLLNWWFGRKATAYRKRHM